MPRLRYANGALGRLYEYQSKPGPRIRLQPAAWFCHPPFGGAVLATCATELEATEGVGQRNLVGQSDHNP
jgi:hypothetical protein